MSYQVVDAVGVASIAAIIKQSGLQKISIVKYGSAKGVLPVFEDNDSKTNDRIVKGFTDWANNILLGNQYNDTVYEVVLYNEPPEEEPDEDTGEKKTIKRGYYRANKMKFNFQLFRSGQPNQQQNERVSGHADPYTPEKLSELVNNEILKNELLRRLTAVENDVNELFDMIADIQENDVSGTEENKTNQYLGEAGAWATAVIRTSPLTKNAVPLGFGTAISVRGSGARREVSHRSPNACSRG